VYQRADMAHADPISTCHPRLLATNIWSVTHDRAKGSRQIQEIP
jgi:hypothetical protein